MRYTSSKFNYAISPRITVSSITIHTFRSDWACLCLIIQFPHHIYEVTTTHMMTCGTFWPEIINLHLTRSMHRVASVIKDRSMTSYIFAHCTPRLKPNPSILVYSIDSVANSKNSTIITQQVAIVGLIQKNWEAHLCIYIVIPRSFTNC